MKYSFIFFLLGFTCILVWAGTETNCQHDVPEEKQEAIVLLHGLGRTSSSMDDLAEALEKSGYHVANIDYQSRKMAIEDIASQILTPEVEVLSQKFSRVHFVTHSMGGIVVRKFLEDATNDRIGRVVMLAPPNKGSEIIDLLGPSHIFQKVMGPAALQLSTAPDSLSHSIAPNQEEIGIIAGDISFNPITSVIVKGEDDGKVAVQSTRLDGAADHLVVHSSHTFIMTNPAVINQVLHFLDHGRFQR
ncbi:MAG: alpha/beta fold hydrolase [Desulfocapsaceae bacterium]|nr:alpha/beta fold hydrolase [Desulfocapsaceae bacterium]